jgi:hypothetical protein
MKKAALWIGIFGAAVLAAAEGVSGFLKTDAPVVGIASAAGACALLLSLAMYSAALARALLGGRGGRTAAALLALHTGLFCAVCGLLLDEIAGEKGFVYIREGTSAQSYFDDGGKEHRLGFPVFCRNFSLSVYPGTLRVKSYRSDLLFGAEKTPGTVRVNEPFSYGGFDFYQQSYGIEPGPAYRIEVTVSAGGKSERLSVRPGERAEAEGLPSFEVLDFSPTLAFAKDGSPVTLNADAMLNPAYLVHAESAEGEVTRWMIPAQPETLDALGAHFDFHDFWGIEYTVLSAVRAPFAPLFEAGAALAAAGAALWLFFRRRTHS